MAKMPYLPATISAEALQSLPADYQGAYIDDHDDGNFRLIKRVAEMIEGKLTEIEVLEKERDEGIAQRDATLSKAKAARNAETINTQLKAALLAAGATDNLAPAAIALLCEQHTFEVEEGYGGEAVITAQTEAGLQSVQLLVETFLDSDEGAAFRPKRPAPNDGYFISLMADLKQRR